MVLFVCLLIMMGVEISESLNCRCAKLEEASGNLQSKLCLKARLAIGSDQVAQSFINLDFENLQGQ